MLRRPCPTRTLVAVLLSCAPLSPLPTWAATSAKYLIVFQGDGMGAEHVKAGGMYVHGAAGSLVFEAFPNQTLMTHDNASGSTTDSAASASAMAAGVKVNNGVISVRLPGDGSDLTSLLELHRTRGRSAGLVTTSYLTDASPAAHGAHDPSRYNTAALYGDYMDRSQPEVLFGGGGYDFDTVRAAAGGYAVVTTRAALLALDPEAQTRVAGSFGNGALPPDGATGRGADLPTLPEMTARALAVLDNDPEGCFAFIEHEGTDESSHANDALGMVLSVRELDSAVQKAIDWVNDPDTDADWNNTLVLVLADHETGGLTVTETIPQAGVVPAVAWSTTGHTQTPVRVFARGVGADQITGAQIDNTDIFVIANPAGTLPAPTPTASSTPPVLRGERILAFPNPGRERIRFDLQLERDRTVRVLFYNPAGERVAELQETLPAGASRLVWDCRNAATGSYFVRVLFDGERFDDLKVYVLH